MRTLLLLLVFLSTSFFSFSQTGNVKETGTAIVVDTIKLKVAINEFCSCFTVISDSIHPYISEMVQVAVKNGQKAAEDTLTARLIASPDHVNAVMKSVAMMEGEKLEATLAKCLKAAERKYPQLSEENDVDGKINKYFIEMMGRTASCKFIYYLMKAGEK
jgi:hypothetical protein